MSAIDWRTPAECLEDEGYRESLLRRRSLDELAAAYLAARDDAVRTKAAMEQARWENAEAHRSIARIKAEMARRIAGDAA